MAEIFFINGDIMGFNTTIVILNDGLDAIKNDKDFGKKVYDAIMENWSTNKPVTIKLKLRLTILLKGWYAAGVILIGILREIYDIINDIADSTKSKTSL